MNQHWKNKTESLPHCKSPPHFTDFSVSLPTLTYPLIQTYKSHPATNIYFNQGTMELLRECHAVINTTTVQ